MFDFCIHRCFSVAMRLRDYQIEAVNKIRKAYSDGAKKVLFVLPTGGGKTAIFSHITESAFKKSNSVFILVHREELLLQSSRKLAELGVPHGRISPAFSQTRDKIQVCSVQTLVNRIKNIYGSPDLLIIDEAHHSTAGSYSKILTKWNNSLVLGVTATPERMDGTGLGNVFDTMIEGPSIEYLTKSGHLSEFKIYAPPMNINFEGIKISQGDYAKGEMEKVMDKPSITGSAVDHYSKLCNGLPAIAFCTTVKHANDVSAQFNSSGISSKCIDGTMDKLSRRKVIDGLGKDYSVLTSCEIVSEGTDIPAVAGAILLRPTLSLGLYLQQVGRILRPYEGKEYSVILDHVGNVVRHGFPDEIRRWSLDGKKRKSKQSKEEEDLNILVCPACYSVFKVNTQRQCPACGSISQPKIMNQIEEVDGSLIELDREKQGKKMLVARARTLEQLQDVAAQLGYKPGWAYFVYKSRKKGVA
ncbi:SSL2 DNA or RNA helicases of superfamily II [uncultured Caudovirales phage]|uniref:SSL2 DNA or RNA helicases of superfamily II n=1 Tax=uncultured Caudovirales phage TaxID=2100421 RepID=A0A6J5NF11_9CAUD|nr:SSL2 DNA or RNA helicases of superfamily II [uncultured Caudovirales phage]